MQITHFASSWDVVDSTCPIDQRSGMRRMFEALGQAGTGLEYQLLSGLSAAICVLCMRLRTAVFPYPISLSLVSSMAFA